MTKYYGSVLGVECMCILAVYWEFSVCVFQLCTWSVVIMYSSCALGCSDYVF